MEILYIQTHPALKKAKQHLIYAFVSSIVVCMLFSFITQLNTPQDVFFNFLMLAALCYGVYAIYQFSKITRASIFRYYTYMLGVQVICSILFVFYHNIIFFFIVIGYNIYCFYKIAHEMQTITDLPHFVTAFKLYVICICAITAVIVAIVGSNIGMFVGTYTEAELATFMATNKNLLLTILFLLLVILITFCISIGFVLRGLIKISYVKVHTP